MAEQRSPLPFEPKGSGKVAKEPAGTKQEAIPRYVADRMARRVAVFTGLPSIAGMGVFVAGTAVNQLVGSDPSSNGLGDEFHRHRTGRERTTSFYWLRQFSTACG